MKVKHVDGLIRITLDRQDWSYLLLAICRKFLDDSKTKSVLSHWRDNLDERGWDLVVNHFELSEIPIYLDRDMALNFSDDLVDALFPPTKKKKAELKLVRVCVDCQKAYVTTGNKEPHFDCEVNSSVQPLNR